MHLPKVAAKVRPPRMLAIDSALGYTFGLAGHEAKQKEILLDLLDFALTGGAEEISYHSYQVE